MPVEVRQTEVYAAWFRRLADLNARARIDVRIRRLSLGNPGDVRSVGGGVSELRVDYGPGYRVYFTRRGKAIVLLLCGGDKRTQDADIAAAKGLVQQQKGDPA
jgi:putative addiction module killer protein